MATFSSSNVRCSILLLSAFLLAIIGFANVEARRLGGEKCTWGPSYWCQNIRQSSAVNFFDILEYVKSTSINNYGFWRCAIFFIFYVHLVLVLGYKSLYQQRLE